MPRKSEWVQRSHSGGEVVVQINGELIDVGTAHATEHLTQAQARSLATHLLAAARNLDAIDSAHARSGQVEK